MNNKQIPFRYDEKLEEDFNELFTWQNYTKKKNQALIEAVEICAKLSRVIKNFKGENTYWSNPKYKINELIKQLEKISKKKVIEKDIKNLDLAR